MKETMSFTHTNRFGEIKTFTFEYDYYDQAGFKFEQFIRFVTGDNDLVVSIDFEDEYANKFNTKKKGKK